MADKPTDPVEITIQFTEQQMELIQALASETGKSPAEAVGQAVEAFIRNEGFRYTR